MALLKPYFAPFALSLSKGRPVDEWFDMPALSLPKGSLPTARCRWSRRDVKRPA